MGLSQKSATLMGRSDLQSQFLQVSWYQTRVGRASLRHQKSFVSVLLRHYCNSQVFLMCAKPNIDGNTSE